MFRGDTKNQHYLSQVEQRMNALNPQATKRNQRIYKFSVVDRDTPSMRLESEDGVYIRNSLSCLDLFSFDVEKDSTFRLNLEQCFGRYEDDVFKYSREVVANIRSGDVADLSQPIVGLFAAKLMNLLRNPYSFIKVMNTVGVAADYRFNDAEMVKMYERILHGSRPHAERVLREFGMDSEAYARWLKVLFNIFSEVDVEGKKYSSFNATVNGMFASSYVHLHLYIYERGIPGNVCLLSDRGMTFCSKDEEPLVFGFNVDSRCFAKIAFLDPVEHAIQRGYNLRLQEMSEALRGRLDVGYSIGDVTRLSHYNRLTLTQCHSCVYASERSPLLHV